MSAAEPIRAPGGAVGWSSADGWLYEPRDLPEHDTGELVLVVSADGMLYGVLPTTRAPLRALLRVEGDLADVVERLGVLGDRLAGVDVAEATDVSELRARMTALIHRVTRLEGRQEGNR